MRAEKKVIFFRMQIPDTIPGMTIIQNKTHALRGSDKIIQSINNKVKDAVTDVLQPCFAVTNASGTPEMNIPKITKSGIQSDIKISTAEIPIIIAESTSASIFIFFIYVLSAFLYAKSVQNSKFDTVPACQNKILRLRNLSKQFAQISKSFFKIMLISDTNFQFFFHIVVYVIIFYAKPFAK